jgi:hypothetical protein
MSGGIECGTPAPIERSKRKNGAYSSAPFFGRAA